MTAEDFEKIIQDVAASLHFEGLDLLPEEKNMLKKLLMLEITEEEFNSWLLAPPTYRTKETAEHEV